MNVKLRRTPQHRLTLRVDVVALLGGLVITLALARDVSADDKPTNVKPDEVLTGTRTFFEKTALPDGSFRPGIDPDYQGFSDTGYSDLAAITYAVVLHKTFGWKLPHEDKTLELLLARQRSDGSFVNVRGSGDPQSSQARLYNTTQGVVALHALRAKPRYDPLPVFAAVLKDDYKKLPLYTTSFFPLAYLAAGQPIPNEEDRKIRELMVQADDGYVRNHIASTFHLVHYFRLVNDETPKADAIVTRVLRDQKPDGSWQLHQPSWDVHAGFDAVFTLKQLGRDRADCRQAIDKAATWALSCRNSDGGFGHFPGYTSDIDAIYFHVGTLVMAGFLKPVDPLPKDPHLLSWGHLFPLSVAAQQKLAPDADFSAELPRIAPKSPEDSLRSMRLKAGFHAEIVASEPLIRSPMAIDFDEFGRAFVVELPEYNQYGSSKPHGKGAVKRLEDTDGDGRFDRATVYVKDLNYPTAVACWDGGVLVGVAPDILYCKDTDGDGQADQQRRLFTGFGQDKSGEGMLNSFRWRIDNRFHIPTGLDGGEVSRVLEPVAGTDANKKTPAVDAAGRASTRAISVRGEHLLLEPRGMTIQATGGGGQHGMSLDDWNLHGFVCGNSEPAHLLMYDSRYVARNPYLQAPVAAINIAPDGKFTKLMRISAVEPWRVLRTRLRSTGAIPGSDEGGTPSGFFTGATGITVYRGDAWPAEYRGQLFVGEVSNNLIYRARLEPNGVGLTAQRADADAEFLASSDNWFRPVQFGNAPDGTLYVLDMYRELIEGAAFLVPQILKHMDTSAGVDMGRIYRIAPVDFQYRTPPRLGDLSTVELVKLFEHRNGWHRDTASRLIYQRQDRAAIEPLRHLASHSPFPLARTMALYSLQGLSALEPAQVIAALRSDSTQQREHALRLAEAFFLADRADVRDAVLPLAEASDVRLRYQAAFTLGEIPGDSATRALVKLAVQDGADPWIRLAILSSVATRRGEFLSAVLRESRDHQGKLDHVRSLAAEVAGQIGAANVKADLAIVLRLVDTLSESPGQERLAEELVRNLISQGPSMRELLAGAVSDRVKSLVASMTREALASARDEQLKPAARATAIRSLAAAEFSQVRELFTELLQSRQPQPVQTATLETLARFASPEVPQLVIAAWPSQTPQVRATSVETLFTRGPWIPLILDAVENRIIAPADLDPGRVAQLKQNSDVAIRERAIRLFASSALARRQDVVDAYQKSLELKGDVDRGRTHFRRVCAACHRLENFGESIGADLNAIRDRGTAAVLLNVLDPNREVKPQFLTYAAVLNNGRTLSGMILAETANSLTVRKADNTTETILRNNIDELVSTGLSFMPEGLEKQLDTAAMADVLAYLNSIK